MRTELLTPAFNTDFVRGTVPEATDVYATGSRVICPVGTLGNGSDWDFVVLVPDLAYSILRLMADGFEDGPSMKSADLQHEVPQFASLKKEKLNLIVTSDKEFYDGFCLSTRVAMALGLTMRPQRVLVFQAILYGNG